MEAGLRRRSHHGSSGRVIISLALVAVCVGLAIGYRTCSRPAGLLGQLNCHYTVIDLKSGYRIRPALARNDRSETLAEICKRLKPYAAIIGTYYGQEHEPLGDIVADGKVVCRGCQRQGIGFTSSGKIMFLERKGSSRIDWRGCYAGVACGPRLVRNGKIDINVTRDGFRKGAATIEATRCSIGATRDGKLVLLAITDYVTLQKVAEAMRELGAVDAINLDGGALCGLYLDGKVVAEPISPVSNVIAVYKTR